MAAPDITELKELETLLSKPQENHMTIRCQSRKGDTIENPALKTFKLGVVSSDNEQGFEAQSLATESQIIVVKRPTGYAPCDVCFWSRSDPVMVREFVNGRASRDNIQKYAEQGCPSCAIILDCLKLSSRSPGDFFPDIQICDSLTYQVPGCFFSGNIQVFAPATEQDPPDGVPKLGVSSGDSSSELAMEWANSRILECVENHSRCRGDINTALPNRIIYIDFSCETKDVQLREFLSDPPRERYIALSHCWGGEMPSCLTTKETLSRWKTSIPWRIIPRTFQEAISFTRRLGVQYIWIDSVCIVQDDAEDWRTQSSKMADIFGNSFLTLAAVHSDNCHKGLSSKMSSDHRSHKISELWDGDKKCQLYARNALPGFHSRITPQGKNISPLFSRAWVYQERLLPPRILYFTRDELAWECREATDCECVDIMRRGHSDIRSDLGATFDYVKIKHHQSLHHPTDIDTRWLEIVPEYSGLLLTKETDKLPAVSGIAKQIQERRPEARYLAGLWSDTLRKDLLWSAAIWPPPLRPSRWIAPSWSWASIGCKAYYSFLEHPGKTLFHFNIPYFLCKHVEGSPLGEVLSGHVTVEGKLSPCLIHRRNGYLRPAVGFEDRNLSFSFSPDYNYWVLQSSGYREAGSEAYILKMASIGAYSYSMVLIKVDEQRRIYHRIGFLHRRNGAMENIDSYLCYTKVVINIK